MIQLEIELQKKMLLATKKEYKFLKRRKIKLRIRQQVKLLKKELNKVIAGVEVEVRESKIETEFISV